MNSFFNLAIDEKLEKEIIAETNSLSCVNYIEFRNLSDCHLFFLSYFDIYHGSYSQELDKILESWFTLLSNYTCFTAEYICNHP
ncbi:MAG TPA: hypothetical protein CFH82_06595 [Sulfurospirillum sp. UBA12182]|nr:MAG TPA: hypothetical protein CFH82_06595 [Sulfurospirillum sp. UBA12182]